MDRQVLKITWLLINLGRPATAPTYSDEHIERWASVYVANPALRLLGVPFSFFLAQPETFLLYIGNPMRGRDGERQYQLSSKEQLLLREALRRCAPTSGNGRLVEKLRHHRHPKSKRNFLPLVEA